MCALWEKKFCYIYVYKLLTPSSKQSDENTSKNSILLFNLYLETSKAPILKKAGSFLLFVFGYFE